jgi:hypothetical protein
MQQCPAIVNIRSGYCVETSLSTHNWQIEQGINEMGRAKFACRATKIS